MKTHVSIILLLIGILFLGSNKAFAQPQEITLATGEWPPYTSESLEGYGVFTEIVSAVFKEMGLKPVYKFLPWKRAEKMVETGEVFAAFPYVVTDKRQESYEFSKRVALSTGRFFYCTKRFPQEVPYGSLSDLKPYKVGGVRGYWYESLFNKALLETDFVDSEKQIIKMLYMQRVDLVALDELVGWHLIRQLYSQDVQLFKTLDKPLNQSGLHLLVSRTYQDAPALTKQFDAALELIRQKGIYHNILRRYGGAGIDIKR